MEALKLMAEGLLPVLAATLIALLHALVAQQIARMRARKTLDITRDEEFAIQGFVADAVAYAEESAHQLIKNGRQVDGSQKLTEAVRFVQNRAQERGLDRIAESKIQDLIQARLGHQRSGGNQ